jgi:hypothetical protein
MLSSYTWSDEVTYCIHAVGKVIEYSDSTVNPNRRDRQHRESLAREYRGESLLVFQIVLRKLLHSLVGSSSSSMSTNVSTARIQAISLSSTDERLPAIDWSKIPASLQPKGGYLPTKRIARKTQQVLRMMQLSMQVIKQYIDICTARDMQASSSASHVNKTLRIVEFCAGSGFVLLPLAALYPQHEFILIDMKGPSLDIARLRMDNTDGLSNVRIVQGLIQDFDEAFDVGIALHACGSASDIVLDK